MRVHASLALLCCVAFSAQICQDSGTGHLFAVRTASCPASAQRTSIAGANIFDAWWIASSGQPTPGSTYQDALDSLHTAKASGVRVFRFFALPWGPYCSFYIQNKTRYWAELDSLMQDIDATGLYYIPSIGYSDWYKCANEVLGTNETLNDQIRVVSSTSRRLAVEYAGQFAQRYADRERLLLWELGNELNLMVNLPPPACGGQQCFNHSEMANFTTALVDSIRAADRPGRDRPISSGFSVPRASAWHQEHCPLNSPGNVPCEADKGAGYWSVDSVEQWSEALREQEQPCDVWSIHFYDKPKDCYFNKSACVRNATVVNVAERVAAESGAILYLGEYGGPNPNFTGPLASNQAFPRQMLETQVSSRRGIAKGGPGAFALSTIWAWKCPTHAQDMVCIDVNSTEAKEAGSIEMAKLLAEANANLSVPLAV